MPREVHCSLISPNTAEFSHLLLCQAIGQGECVTAPNQSIAEHWLHAGCLAQGDTAQADSADILCGTSRSLMLSSPCMA